MGDYRIILSFTTELIKSTLYYIVLNLCTQCYSLLQTGVGETRCSDCDDGFFAFSPAGCLMCNCSGRTSECQLDPTSPISVPQEICQCPFPHSGSSCERCVDGYFLSSMTGNCEICQCNGRAYLCQDGTGECIVSLP